jgi:beta-lactamase class D
MLKKILFTLYFLLVCPLFSQNLEGLFKKYNVEGSLVIASLDGKTQHLYNASRASTPMITASTFKMINTLIALDEGVITDDKMFLWDGKDRGWSAWNKNQNLKSAFQISCVWCYQQIARSLSHDIYHKHMKKIGYGNTLTGSKLDTFWLDGDLRISSFEQIEFLKRLYANDLPFKKEHLKMLKEMMKLKTTPTYTIYGKTGWATSPDPSIGWFVGYVKTKDDVYFFAVNLDMPNKKMARYRQIIIMEALQIKGII